MRISDGVDTLMEGLAAQAGEGARARVRAARVNAAWEDAVRAVYRDAADLVLSHVNAVYVMAADAQVRGAHPSDPACGGGGAQLVVYCDDSTVRSDLDARQEFLKMRLRERGEHVGTLKTVPSSFGMRERHPFAAKPRRGDVPDAGDGRPPMAADTYRGLLERAENLEDPALRRVVEEAITADFKRDNSKK